MKKIKEVSVFTNGDSCKLSTWSNVPYFFTQALTAKGIKVNRIDLSPDPSLEKRWNKFMGRVMRRIFKGTSYCYFRSFTHQYSGQFFERFCKAFRACGSRIELFYQS